jgi:tRNA-specific 2-thiouridylase
LENKTKQLGCDYLATGHYARIKRDEATGRYQILKGVDATRDQSYFLWGLKQESLERTLFPLGEMRKREVRALAQEYGLINADREDSREICFVPNNDYTKLVENKEPNLPGTGVIRDLQGNVVGKHEGYYKYTVGQRRRIEIKTNEKKYVTKIIPERNEIVIGDDADLFEQSFTVKEINWVAFDPTTTQQAEGVNPSPPQITALAKIRYLHKPVPATLSLLTDRNVEVTLHKAQRAITPGQSCVFYDGDIVLGGGKIA